jgi:regulator of sirC expression with transglutaminase-like and TPR domain
MRLDTIPLEILNRVLRYLIDDGNAVVRLSMTSKVFHERISSNEPLWEEIVRQRWTANLPPPERKSGDSSTGSAQDMEENSDSGNSPSSSSTTSFAVTNYRSLYLVRRRTDEHVLQLIAGMAQDLQAVLELDDNHLVDSSHVNLRGEDWTHELYQNLTSYGLDAYDILKSIAKKSFPQGEYKNAHLSVLERLSSFLAAKSLHNILFIHGLRDWQQNNQNEYEKTTGNISVEISAIIIEEITRWENYASQQPPGDVLLQLESAKMLEHYAFQVCEIGRTPIELFQEKKYGLTVNEAKRSLDEIANVCRAQIHEAEKSSINWPMNISDRMQLINDVIVNQFGYGGNSEDYYDHRNSLLDHVIKSKKGIPLTLAILYSCVCRRLEMPVQITGLPGHVVIEFGKDSDVASSERAFMDVFHGGRILTVVDCQQIVSNYTLVWEDRYLMPLRNNKVLERMFNNLMICHKRALANNVPFHGKVYSHHSILWTVHSQAPLTARPMAERVIEILRTHITLDEDLLGAYELFGEK